MMARAIPGCPRIARGVPGLSGSACAGLGRSVGEKDNLPSPTMLLRVMGSRRLRLMEQEIKRIHLFVVTEKQSSSRGRLTLQLHHTRFFDFLVINVTRTLRPPDSRPSFVHPQSVSRLLVDKDTRKSSVPLQGCRPITIHQYSVWTKHAS